MGNFETRKEEVGQSHEEADAKTREVSAIQQEDEKSKRYRMAGILDTTRAK